MITVLFVGDVVGKIGRDALIGQLPALKSTYKPDLIIVNGENSANGKGITTRVVEEYLKAGVHCITSGNHVFDNREIQADMGSISELIRPLNYSPRVPGNIVYKTTIGKTTIGVINVLGQVFMPPINHPFDTVEDVLESELADTDIIILDVHAEATSEKKALALHFAGRLSAVVGTHTHVQTSDACILNDYTAFLTDVGMVGARNSILGMESEPVIQRFLTAMPERFSPPVSDSERILDFTVMEFEPSGKATHIESHHLIIR
jgi:metallophosphoesterase (TIGR00282 family)